MLDPGVMAQDALSEGVLSTSRARSMLVVPVVFVSLSTVFVTARFIAKRLRKERSSSDDLLIVAALVRFPAPWMLESTLFLITATGYALSADSMPTVS
nr:hypothetical protein CFP56_42215 [Quercus suber]